MIWLWIARSDVTVELWEINREDGRCAVACGFAGYQFAMYQEVVLNGEEGVKSPGAADLPNPVTVSRGSLIWNCVEKNQERGWACSVSMGDSSRG